MRQGLWAARAQEGHVDSAPYSKNIQISLWILLLFILSKIKKAFILRVLSYRPYLA